MTTPYNTIQHLQVCGPEDQSCLTMWKTVDQQMHLVWKKHEKQHVIWLAGFCPSNGIKTVRPLRKEPKRMDHFPAFDQCWNSSVLLQFVELHNTLPESMQPDSSLGNGPHKKKHTDTNFGVHTLCIHPLRYLYEFMGYIFPSIKGTRCRSKTSPGISSGGGRFRFLGDQRPGGQTTSIAASYMCLNKLECQVYF